MAINLEITQSAGSGREPGQRANVIELPGTDFDNITVAGTTVLTAGTRRVLIRNRTGGDSVYVKVQATAGRANAAVGTAFHLAATQEVSFMLPKGVDPTAYEVDVRAV